MEKLREAVEIEDGFAYMEPPRVYQPVRQCLGYVLLRAEKLEDAEKVRGAGNRKETTFFPVTLSRHLADAIQPPPCLRGFQHKLRHPCHGQCTHKSAVPQENKGLLLLEQTHSLLGKEQIL